MGFVNTAILRKKFTHFCARSAQTRARASGSTEFLQASEKVSEAASSIAKKLARLMKEVDTEAHQHFGSEEPVQAEDTGEQRGFKVDLRESATAYQCIAEMPGVLKHAIQVSQLTAAVRARYKTVLPLDWRCGLWTVCQQCTFLQLDVDKSRSLCIKFARQLPADSEGWSPHNRKGKQAHFSASLSCLQMLMLAMYQQNLLKVC